MQLAKLCPSQSITLLGELSTKIYDQPISVDPKIIWKRAYDWL